MKNILLHPINSLKEYCYRELRWKNRCICGGKIKGYLTGIESWMVECNRCKYCYDED
jgi:hypothetical protein